MSVTYSIIDDDTVSMSIDDEERTVTAFASRSSENVPQFLKDGSIGDIFDENGRLLPLGTASLDESLRSSGGKGSGNFGHEGRPGEKGGSGEGGGLSERAQRAKEAQTPFTKQKDAHSVKVEQELVEMTGGRGTDDNLPADVVTHFGGKTQGIEVKSMQEVKSNQITMRKEAQEKKLSWMRSNHASFHTVVVDDRDKFSRPEHFSGNRIYYKRGFGSFRITTMTKVKDAEHLKELIAGAQKRAS